MFLIKTISLITAVTFGLNYALPSTQLKLLAAKRNETYPGNNNHLITSLKCNFPPYGKDFFQGQPSGRFSNGRLTTDFIAEAFDYTVLKAFLDPNISSSDLLQGVSFASSGSGYDELTASLSSNVISLPKQLENFRHYKNHLRNLVGIKESEEIVQNALVLLSLGPNDFLLNYYAGSILAKQYDIEQYQNFLIFKMQTAIKTMKSLGVRKLALLGVPSFGCLPLVKNARHEIGCDAELNRVASSFNSKIQMELKTMQGSSFRTIYLDTYSVLLNVTENPSKYGFDMSLKGCCGTGTFEFGITCGLSSTLCNDESKYVFWEAIHPTEKVYKIAADYIIHEILQHNLL